LAKVAFLGKDEPLKAPREGENAKRRRVAVNTKGKKAGSTRGGTGRFTWNLKRVARGWA